MTICLLDFPLFFSFIFFFTLPLFLNNKMKNSNNQQTQQKKVHLIGDYIRQERIGRGSFASVYKAQHKVSSWRKKKKKELLI
jgi:serine/threonine protein kinase